MNRDTEDFLRELLEEDRKRYRETVDTWFNVSATLIILGLVLIVYAW